MEGELARARVQGAITPWHAPVSFIRPFRRTDQGGLTMHRSIRSTLALAMAALVAASVAHAAGGVTVELTASRVTKSQGRDVLAPAEQARPGDLLEYRARYKNDGKAEARGLAATLPIPRGTQYVPGTALPRRVEASLDGHTFAPVPLTRKVRLADGRTVTRDVPVSEYVALRWPLGALPASQSREVTARVRVEPAQVAALAR
jgi:uncharacterized repeat protein (TIGR01451 family)